MSGGAINGKFNSSGNFGFPPDGGGIGAGATEADLRYLGSKRVLVLVDGVRWVNGSSASGVAAATDLNTIPLAIIDRVEVLEDGASPIYGSDAIAGVINIITRKEFDGVIRLRVHRRLSPGRRVRPQVRRDVGQHDRSRCRSCSARRSSISGR